MPGRGESMPYRGWTNPTHAFARRQSQIAAGLAAQAQVRDQAGTILVAMSDSVAGEGVAPVTFAFTFIEKPIFTFGSELAENQVAVAGAFPTCSMTVHNWVTKKVGHATFWQGCTVGFVLTGTPATKFYVHYSFRGNTLTNSSPAYNDTGTA